MKDDRGRGDCFEIASVIASVLTISSSRLTVTLFSGSAIVAPSGFILSIPSLGRAKQAVIMPPTSFARRTIDSSNDKEKASTLLGKTRAAGHKIFCSSLPRLEGDVFSLGLAFAEAVSVMRGGFLSIFSSPLGSSKVLPLCQ